ncbi:MAG TPA: pilus assembly protein TadG-related protein [Bryobacteraceae bacterium]|nr:pilus assembly protein TadG-related protein [Bryobacteraceae bacterium]
MWTASSRITRREAGFTLIATALCLAALLGLLALAVDLGRLYITKTEAQAFADAAALTAVKELNGKSSGISSAITKFEALRTVNKWNMGTSAFTSTDTRLEFSKTALGPWTQAGPQDALYARVTATPTLGLTLMTIVNGPRERAVAARSVAGVVPATFKRGGYLPFRVVAHTMTGDPNFGLTIGQEYTIRWPGNPRVGQSCKGDDAQAWIDNAGQDQGNSVRGYFELSSASAIRAAILGQRQLVPLNLGDVLRLTSGNKNTERDALRALANRDTDTTTYRDRSSYTLTPGVRPPYSGNGNRLVILPISANATGVPGASPSIAGNSVLAFGTFLIPLEYDNQGNDPWCAVYMGAKSMGSEDLVPMQLAGAFVTRLVQ